jgi:hypothetical protein
VMQLRSTALILTKPIPNMHEPSMSAQLRSMVFGKFL